MTNPVTFIVGCPRSGTSLLRHMLGAHPQMAITPEAHWNTLHALWPKARFVHLIRDGRDVALSLMNWRRVRHKKPGTFPTWKKDPVSTSALWWELNVRCGRNAGRRLGPELYYELRNESLIVNPAEECAKVCAFLGLPFDHAILRFHEKPEEGLPPQGSETSPALPGLRWEDQTDACPAS